MHDCLLYYCCCTFHSHCIIIIGIFCITLHWDMLLMRDVILSTWILTGSCSIQKLKRCVCPWIEYAPVDTHTFSIGKIFHWHEIISSIFAPDYLNIIILLRHANYCANTHMVFCDKKLRYVCFLLYDCNKLDTLNLHKINNINFKIVQRRTL